MSLLVDIAAQALDPGYAEAAGRRRSSTGSGPGAGTERRGPAWLLVGGVVAATLLVVVAAMQAHDAAPAASRSRDALVSQVTHRSEGIAGLQQRLDRLRTSTTSLRDTALASSAAGNRLARLLAGEELAAGTVAVTGPGLRVTLDDASRSPNGSQNRVVDRDIQAVVNAMWAAGAEAVSVNDQRVTAQTAVRQAGGAVLVNFQPLDAPYVVSAVGDPIAMETAFATSGAAARMRGLAQLYGLQFRYSRSSGLTLPPAPGLTLRYAVPAGTPSGRGGAGR